MNNDSIGYEYCPYCQMPLILLKKQNINLHLEVCSRRKTGIQALLKECPKDIKCDSTMICHYERYSHSKLADARATNNNSTEDSQQSCLSNLSMSLLTFETMTNSSEDFAAEKLNTTKRRKVLRKSSKQSLLSYSKGLSQRKLNLSPKNHLKKTTTNRANMKTSTSLQNGIVQTNKQLRIKKKNDDLFSMTSPCKKSSTLIRTQLQSDVPSLSLNDSVQSPNKSDSKTDTFQEEFSCSPIEKEKHPELDQSSTKMVDFKATAFTCTSTQVKSHQKVSNNTPLSDLQISGNVDDLKKNNIQSNKTTPERKNSFQKRKQADIGCLLFGIKPLEPKKVEPQLENNIETEYTFPNKKKKCPFYKKVDGTDIAVDAFSYGLVPGICFYFLSHFHYDHYMGLNKKFQADIFCSSITGNLLETRLGILKMQIKRLPMNEKIQVGDVYVTLLEANHCPGAVLFLFQLKNNRTILHTGDFRADPHLLNTPAIRSDHIDILYLDTTYLDPKYTFPPQDDVIRYVTETVEKAIALQPRTLVVTGTYCIGKEKIFMGIAKCLNVQVVVTRDKQKVLKCLDDPEINRRITTDPSLSNLHVLPMNKLNPYSLHEYLSKYESSYDRLIAIKPTGWTFKGSSTNLNDVKPSMHGAVMIYGVPYSEHSSFSELQSFVEMLKPNRIIPTVNVGRPESRKRMESYLNCWKQK